MNHNNSNKLKPLIAALGFGLALGVGQATAGVTWFEPGPTTFEDNDLDWHMTVDGDDLILDPDGQLDLGDVLISVFEVNATVNASQTASAAIGPEELTGVVAIQVEQKIFEGQDLSGNDRFTFVFAPYVNGMDDVLALGGVGELPNNLGDAGAGTMAALWLDDEPDLGAPPICSSLADCIGKAGDGDQWEVDGFYGDADEFWTASNALDDIDAVSNLPAATKAGFFNFGVSIGFNGTGEDLGLVDCSFCVGDQKIGVLGSGDLLGGANLTNDAIARSDIDFQKTLAVPVPEPSSLALMAAGAGLLGFGAKRRARRKA